MYLSFVRNNLTFSKYSCPHIESGKAVFTQTTRGKDQLLYCGQPYVYEKRIMLPDGQLKRLWRCNQWYENRNPIQIPVHNSHVLYLQVE